MRVRRPTATSNFGTGRRESHDASAFYGRFRAPALSDDEEVAAPAPVAEPFVHGDARRMDAVADRSVALVVTSPPYFAGKAYEEELARDGVPGSYLEYLEMLAAVFGECVRTLEPGGRIAVNVANLGRRPYRSLASDVTRILQDELGLLLRGELVWQKAQGATGSCAWGSYRSAANPVLRDLTERVVVASKGRFDRARSVARRRAEGLPHESTIATDDFLALTLDVWPIPPESARRVGHPAPFPVELPEQLIRLYTYRGDLVLDPFMGSGSALVAAAGLGRRFVGYDLDASYVDLARRRVAETAGAGPAAAGGVGASAGDGKAAARVAEEALVAAGFGITGRDRRLRGTGVAVSLVAEGARGRQWLCDVAGPATARRGGLRRAEVAWRAVGRSTAVAGRSGRRLVLLTTDLPERGSEAETALRAAGPGVVFDVVDVRSAAGAARLASYAAGETEPQPGFWTPAELSRHGA